MKLRMKNKIKIDFEIIAILLKFSMKKWFFQIDFSSILFLNANESYCDYCIAIQRTVLGCSTFCYLSATFCRFTMVLVQFTLYLQPFI